jgi:hypothetical protein
VKYLGKRIEEMKMKQDGIRGAAYREEKAGRLS